MSKEESLSIIRNLDEQAARAWPAAEIHFLGGWRLRATGGTTRRANSVLTASPPGLPLEEAISQVELFYSRRGLPARFQISPASCPEDLDPHLAERGYKAEGEAHVQVAQISEVLARTAGGKGQGGAPPPRIQEYYDPDWLAFYCQAEHVSDQDRDNRAGILKRIPGRVAFARVDWDGQLVGVGLGVVAQGWLGLFSMATQAEFRRRGVATRLLHGLAKQAQEWGAQQVYLQVLTDNSPALNLYARSGFVSYYRYHYRTRTTG